MGRRYSRSPKMITQVFVTCILSLYPSSFSASASVAFFLIVHLTPHTLKHYQMCGCGVYHDKSYSHTTCTELYILLPTIGGEPYHTKQAAEPLSPIPQRSDRGRPEGSPHKGAREEPSGWATGGEPTVHMHETHWID